MPKSDYKKEMLSLIVTVFNEADTIEDFLRSVQQQSLAPTELIIVDAQSTDNTVNLIKKFAKKPHSILNYWLKLAIGVWDAILLLDTVVELI